MTNNKLIIFMKRVYSEIISDKLIKRVIIVSSGTILAQSINILSQPLITRLYNPTQYGAFSVLTSLLLVFRISTLRFDVAIAIPKEKHEAYSIVAISIISTFFFSIIIAILLGMFSANILIPLNYGVLVNYWYFLPIGIFIQGIYLTLQGWMYRMKDFKMLRRKEVLESITGNTFKIAFGLLNYSIFGILLSKMISILVVAYLLIIDFLKSNNDFFKFVSINTIRQNFSKFRSFAIYQTPSSLSLHLRNQLPIIFLTPIYGIQVAGFFALANQIIKLPMILIGNSVMNVFYVEVASVGKENPRKIKNLADSLFKKLTIIGIVPLFLILILAPSLFSFAFGQNWYIAGQFAQILSVYTFANFIFSPVSRIYEIFNKQREKLIIDTISLLMIAFLFIIAGYYQIPVNILLIMYSFIMSTVYYATYKLSNMIILNEIMKAI
jgi:O-antigen/teichoic acid export membrane protein